MISGFLDARNEYSRWLRRFGCSDAVGIGVGLRVVAGKRLFEPCIQVFVPRKTATKMLSRRKRIPAAIDGVAIDVLESASAVFSGLPSLEAPRTGTPSFSSRQGRAKRRPLEAGISCSNLYSCSGTLGCFCEGLNREGRRATFILGCGHVLRGRESFKSSPAVIQASPSDGGTSRDQVATFERDIPLTAGPDGANLCDAAIAEISPAIPHSNTILGIGTPSGKTEPQLGMAVLKAGRTTGVTRGVVTALAVETWISWSIHDPSMRYRFVDLIRIEGETAGAPFALPGDSGALVVAENSLAAVALYSAGTDQGYYGLASPISTVEKCLDVQIQSAMAA